MTNDVRPHLLDVSMFWSASGLGGVRSVLTAKRSHFGAQGWRHTVMAPRACDVDEIDCGGLPLPGSGGYRFVLGRRRAAALIEQARPDIIEAADPYTLGWAVLDAARTLKVPAVAFCHSNLPALMARLAGGRRTRSGRWAERRARLYLEDLYSGYDLVLAPSQAMTRQLRELGIRQAMHQPLGVDCTLFSPSANDPHWRNRLEGRLGLKPGTRLLVYAGRFAGEKNLDVLSAALQHLGPQHALLAVGAGPRPPRGPGVHILPPETDRRRLARLLASCDAFVHAGDQETFGLAALEAMACGTPVVVSAAGGLGELVKGVGITVGSLHASEWADAIDACLADPHSLLSWDAVGRARMLDWRNVCEQLARRYVQAMRARRPEVATAPMPLQA